MSKNVFAMLQDWVLIYDTADTRAANAASELRGRLAVCTFEAFDLPDIGLSMIITNYA